MMYFHVRLNSNGNSFITGFGNDLVGNHFSLACWRSKKKTLSSRKYAAWCNLYYWVKIRTPGRARCAGHSEKFDSKPAFKQHFRQKHGSTSRRQPCPLSPCKATAGLVFDLKRHLRKVHCQSQTEAELSAASAPTSERTNPSYKSPGMLLLPSPPRSKLTVLVRVNKATVLVHSSLDEPADATRGPERWSRS